MNPCILALDGETSTLAAIEETLGEKGFRVIRARSLDEFRARAAGQAVDLFLIDPGVPGGGLSLVRELRQAGEQGIILLSSRMSGDEGLRGLELGADDAMVKPFLRRELAARVSAVYRRVGRAAVPAPAAPPIDHEFGGYAVSLQVRQVWGPDGAEVTLTTSEFDLLAALIQRRGQVLSRDQIMNAIKGRHWESYERVVDGIVSRLRRKIPPRPRGRPFIRTVHGAGYAFTG